jgi:ATP-dependent Clp protease ATP-binding subunit ClpC
VELSAAARKWLARTGYDPAFGARPLRRALQKYVESPLSMELLGGKIQSGAAVVVDMNADESGLEFKTKEGKAKTGDEKGKK